MPEGRLTDTGAPSARFSVGASARTGTGRVPERVWQELLALLDRRAVIPIIGPDAVVVDGPLGPRTLMEYVARRAEAELEIEPLTPPDRPLTPHGVACRFLAERRGTITDVYGAMKLALDAGFPLEAEPPAALMRLAGIRAFDLYVTTTFDDCLQRAIDRTRFDGRPETQTRAYCPDRVDDLPSPMARLKAPLVYHLLGTASPLPEYAVTEEDTLEFVHSLQSENRSPSLLLAELQSHPLLIIGSDYSDWLARFFLRIAKPGRLIMAGKSDYVTGSHDESTSLKDFLRYFSAQTKVIDVDAVAFVDELADRWAKHEAQPGRAAPQPTQPESDADRTIFLSYANEEEDARAAVRLCEALRAAGLPVWMDKQGGLKGGDDWEQKIEERIYRASLFVPIVSDRTLTAEPRFFRKEWMTACEVTERRPPNLAYIVPVAIDDTRPSAPEIPKAFRARQWFDLRRDGVQTIAEEIKTLFRDYQRALRRP